MNEANVRDTKERILAAAEHLFATQGIEATSLRQITTQAEVNLAAVNYHFSSKEELVRSVYVRRIRPMNVARLARLDALETNEAKPTLDQVLEAFYEPVLDAIAQCRKDGFVLMPMMGRLYSEPNDVAKSIIATEMAETFRRFSTAFGLQLPHLQPHEVIWRLNFTIGMLAHTLSAGAKLQHLSKGVINPADHPEVLRQLKQFALAGLLAPSLESTT